MTTASVLWCDTSRESMTVLRLRSKTATDSVRFHLAEHGRRSLSCNHAHPKIQASRFAFGPCRWREDDKLTALPVVLGESPGRDGCGLCVHMSPISRGCMLASIRRLSECAHEVDDIFCLPDSRILSSRCDHRSQHQHVRGGRGVRKRRSA